MTTARTPLVAAALCLSLLAGCNATRPGLAPNWHDPERPNKSRAGSWFGDDEPAPPQTMKEWMDLEPIRP